MDKNTVRDNFSKCARRYDGYAAVQALCAAKLISAFEARGFGNILEIGCGTGNYTRLLREKFPQAKIKALDISKEMVGIAEAKLKDEGIEFIVADGEEIGFKEEFDLITSNATFQWFENLDKALSLYKGLLRKNGVLIFSIFGPNTLYELNGSLRELLGQDISICSCGFADIPLIKKVLRRFFKEATVEKEIYKDRSASLKEFLEKIIYTGARGNGIGNKNLWTPDMIHRLQEIYKKKFKDIIATYEVFFCKGEK